MQINLTARHGHLNEATQDQIKSKAEKLLRIFERITAIELIVDLKESSKPRVDIKVDAEHKHDFQAHDQSENLLTAVESTVHKLEQQLRRYKERLQERGRDPNARRQEVVSDPEPAADE
ncbi:MAG: ribosome-associated translation inhibitor RaiA [Planctomycetota bacterium]